MVQCHEAEFKLFVAHQQLAKAIDPRAADHDNSATRLRCRRARLGLGVLASDKDVWDLSMTLCNSHQFRTTATRVGAQVFAAPLGRHRALDCDVLEQFDADSHHESGRKQVSKFLTSPSAEPSSGAGQHRASL